MQNDRLELIGHMSDRASAWNLLTEFTQSESLRKHALAVEACMRCYARKFGGDGELWGTVGLLHDFDYERWPSLEEHPYKGNEILKERGYSDEIRRAIMSHANTRALLATLLWRRPSLPATSLRDLSRPWH